MTNNAEEGGGVTESGDGSERGQRERMKIEINYKIKRKIKIFNFFLSFFCSFSGEGNKNIVLFDYILYYLISTIDYKIV